MFFPDGSGDIGVIVRCNVSPPFQICAFTTTIIFIASIASLITYKSLRKPKNENNTKYDNPCLNASFKQKFEISLYNKAEIR